MSLTGEDALVPLAAKSLSAPMHTQGTSFVTAAAVRRGFEIFCVTPNSNSPSLMLQVRSLQASTSLLR